MIPTQPQPLWHARGWRKASNAKEYSGHFASAGRTWRGLVEEPYPGGFRAYIWHPPLEEIRRNTIHSPCFSRNGDGGRYHVHFSQAPRSLDQAITSVELVLAEALAQ